MINFLNDIRNAENPISNNRKLINTIALLFLGIALGSFSKYLDFRQAELPSVLMAINGVLDIGNCSLNGIGQYRRYAHRCEVAIALYQKYCGTGIGKLMLERILTIAKKAGYEQAELEVIATNEYAINLYRKLGFEEYGKFPNNMRYSDATYADALWMMKKL